MKLPQALQDWCLSKQGCLPSRMESLSGGCIADTRRLFWDNGWSAVLKYDRQAAADQFAGEAAGLAALAQAECLRIPQVYSQGSDYLLIEYLHPARRAADYWSNCGRQLALLHASTPSHRGYGFDCATYCGATRQDNSWTEDGHRFFAESRLLALGMACRDRGLLDKKQLRQLEGLCRRLPELIPVQAPALLHGDLWSGNLHVDPQGQAALIDPAAYYGWPEAELAMTRLFGGFPEEFYQSYCDASNIAGDWRERCDIYNLYHLLNHLLLFGTAYAGSVKALLSAW